MRVEKISHTDYGLGELSSRESPDTVPGFSDVQTDWMLQWALESGSKETLAVINNLIADSTLAQYQPKKYAAISKARQQMKEEQKQSLIKEFNAVKTVMREIGTVETGAIGFTN